MGGVWSERGWTRRKKVDESVTFLIHFRISEKAKRICDIQTNAPGLGFLRSTSGKKRGSTDV